MFGLLVNSWTSVSKVALKTHALQTLRDCHALTTCAPAFGVRASLAPLFVQVSEEQRSLVVSNNMFSGVEALIPHRAPMRWVDELIECTETTATATTRFETGHHAVANGVVSETALVECVAQTVAAALGHRLRSAGKSGAANQGMLAAVSNFKIISAPPLDKSVTISVREVKRLGPMLLITSTISCEGHAIASGELSLYA